MQMKFKQLRRRIGHDSVMGAVAPHTEMVEENLMPFMIALLR